MGKLVTLSFSTDISKMVAYQLGISRRDRDIVVPCPAYQDTIPDPKFVFDPKTPDVVAQQIPNPVTLQQYAQSRVQLLINTVISDDLSFQADQQTIADQKTADEVIQTNRKTLLDTLTPVLAVPIDVAVQ